MSRFGDPVFERRVRTMQQQQAELQEMERARTRAAIAAAEAAMRTKQNDAERLIALSQKVAQVAIGKVPTDLKVTQLLRPAGIIRNPKFGPEVRAWQFANPVPAETNSARAEYGKNRTNGLVLGEDGVLHAYYGEPGETGIIQSSLTTPDDFSKSHNISGVYAEGCSNSSSAFYDRLTRLVDSNLLALAARVPD